MLIKKRTGRRPILNLQMQTFIPSEYQECKAFWKYANLSPKLSDSLIKHANERIGYSWFTKALVAIGMSPGLMDYQWPVPNQKYLGLWIEMKKRDQRDAPKKKEQEAWIEKLNKIGHYAAYAYGCEDAIRIYTDYVNNKL